MSLKRKEYHVDSQAKHAAIFFVACELNPATFVKNPFCDASKRVLLRGVKGQDDADAGPLGDWKI